MEATGIPNNGVPLTVEEAYTKLIADLTARSLRQPTIRKHELMQRKLQEFCEQHGYIFLRQLGIDQVREFRNTWKLNPRTAAKSLERLRSFFKFCVDSEWIDKNPAKAIKSAKVEDADVLPFNESEVKKILKACDTFNATATESKPLLN